MGAYWMHGGQTPQRRAAARLHLTETRGMSQACVGSSGQCLSLLPMLLASEKRGLVYWPPVGDREIPQLVQGFTRLARPIAR